MRKLVLISAGMWLLASQCAAQNHADAKLAKGHGIIASRAPITATANSSTAVQEEAEKYKALLDDADIGSDPDIRHAIYSKWVDTTCESKRLRVNELLGSASTDTGKLVFFACQKRLMALESPSGQSRNDPVLSQGQAQAPTAPINSQSDSSEAPVQRKVSLPTEGRNGPQTQIMPPDTTAPRAIAETNVQPTAFARQDSTPAAPHFAPGNSNPTAADKSENDKNQAEKNEIEAKKKAERDEKEAKKKADQEKKEAKKKAKEEKKKAAQDSMDDSSQSILIGGFEQSGYSSLAQSTNPFLNAYIRGPERLSGWSGWGRVRLLSAPQPSTQGIVSTFTDPTGALMKVDLTKVGQAIDFVGGPQYRIGPIGSHWSFVAGFGATTPLSSQDVTASYQVPALGTIECSTLVSRFSAANGYTPGLVADPANKTCLQGGFTTVSFSNQDRSNFLMKYGAGFRTTYPVPCNTKTTSLNDKAATPADDASSAHCEPSYRSLDITFGQDAAVTGGKLRGAVMKLDGVLPIQTGDSSFLYLFGSVYMRLHRNQNESPLILQAATGVTIPSNSVIVLPLLQPNRDFYRLGVGLNITQLFCKFGAGCPNKDKATSPDPAKPSAATKPSDTTEQPSSSSAKAQ